MCPSAAVRRLPASWGAGAIVRDIHGCKQLHGAVLERVPGEIVASPHRLIAGDLPQTAIRVSGTDEDRKTQIKSSSWAGSSVVEHLTFNQMVEGSIPSPLTNEIIGLEAETRNATRTSDFSGSWPVRFLMACADWALIRRAMIRAAGDGFCSRDLARSWLSTIWSKAGSRR